MKKSSKKLLLFCRVLAGVAWFARAEAAETAGAVGPAWQAAWNAKRADQAAALFAPDAVFTQATGRTVAGRPAILLLMHEMLKATTPAIAMSPALQGEAGDTAWVSGTSKTTVPSTRARPARNVQGRYLLVLHHGTADGWLIEQMMWGR